MRVATPKKCFATAVLVLGLSAAWPGTARGEPNCRCRYDGRSFALETCVCIVTPQGTRRACCDKVLNNTSWTFTGETCPIASAPDRSPAQSVARRPRPPVDESPRRDERWRTVAVAE